MTKQKGSFVSNDVDYYYYYCEGQDSSVNIVNRMDGRDQFLRHKETFIAASPLKTLEK
jgi:hypothetical protein